MSLLPPRAALDALAARLGATPSEKDELRAVVDGVTLFVRYVLRGAGSSSFQFTEVSVTGPDLAGLPFRFGLDMNVRPAHAADAREVKAGRLRDIVLGDPAFDDAFVVEAAPADVVCALLGPAVRSEMLALLPIHVYTTPTVTLEIDREGWLDDVDVLERFVRLAARLGGSIVAAAREALEARRNAPLGGGYRDRPPTHDEIQRDWEADVRALGEARKRRDVRTTRIALAGVLAALVLTGAFVAAVAAVARP